MPEKSHLPQVGGEVRPAPTPVPGDFTPDGIPDNDPPPPDAPYSSCQLAGYNAATPHRYTPPAVVL